VLERFGQGKDSARFGEPKAALKRHPRCEPSGCTVEATIPAPRHHDQDA
jgi:hypothetical protein